MRIWAPGPRVRSAGTVRSGRHGALDVRRAGSVVDVRQWQEHLATGIRAMRAAGHVPASLDVDRTAAALLAGIQDGVSILLSTGSSAHLRAE